MLSVDGETGCTQQAQSGDQEDSDSDSDVPAEDHAAVREQSDVDDEPAMSKHIQQAAAAAVLPSRPQTRQELYDSAVADTIRAGKTLTGALSSKLWDQALLAAAQSTPGIVNGRAKRRKC